MRPARFPLLLAAAAALGLTPILIQASGAQDEKAAPLDGWNVDAPVVKELELLAGLPGVWTSDMTVTVGEHSYKTSGTTRAFWGNGGTSLVRFRTSSGPRGKTHGTSVITYDSALKAYFMLSTESAPEGAKYSSYAGVWAADTRTMTWTSTYVSSSPDGSVAVNVAQTFAEDMQSSTTRLTIKAGPATLVTVEGTSKRGS